jgi:hypothetical protein
MFHVPMLPSSPTTTILRVVPELGHRPIATRSEVGEIVSAGHQAHLDGEDIKLGGSLRQFGQSGQSGQSSSLRAETKASWGTSTRPIFFIFFFPSFCFSNNLRLRVISPP